MDVATVLLVLLYVLPLLVVFAVAAWISDIYERRHPPQNRRVR